VEAIKVPVQVRGVKRGAYKSNSRMRETLRRNETLEVICSEREKGWRPCLRERIGSKPLRGESGGGGGRGSGSISYPRQFFKGKKNLRGEDKTFDVGEKGLQKESGLTRPETEENEHKTDQHHNRLYGKLGQSSFGRNVPFAQNSPRRLLTQKVKNLQPLKKLFQAKKGAAARLANS